MKLLNEKSLELNISHELLNLFTSSYSVGVTLQDETNIGVDSWLKTPYLAFFFQYKAPYRGVDGKTAFFRINSNRPHYDQHVTLKHFANFFPNAVFYVFPLAITDNYFRQVAGNLTSVTIFPVLDTLPTVLPGNPHRMEVFADGSYVFHSEKKEEKGMTGKEFVEKMKERQVGYNVGTSEEDFDKFFDEVKKCCREFKIARRRIKIYFFHPEYPFFYSFFTKYTKYTKYRSLLSKG